MATAVTMTVKQAKAIAGNVSTKNTKMGTTTFAIDAFACKVGDRLAKVVGSVCSKCYARRIQKIRPNVDKGWKANLDKWNTAVATGTVDLWIKAIAFQITRYNTDDYHRWFDSGDLQSVEMLDAIARVAKLTPNIKHWLPTREVSMVLKFTSAVGSANVRSEHKLPSNLVVRVSSPMVNGHSLAAFKHTSTVHDKDDTPEGFGCEAHTRGNACGPCKACWDTNVKNVSYPKH